MALVTFALRALLVSALLLLAAGCGDDTPDDGAGTATAPPEQPADTTPAEPVLDCSSAGAQDLQLPEQAALPPAVDDLRRELFDAALDCDFETLGDLATGTDAGFSYTFGQPDPQGPAAYWQRIDPDERVMEQLARVLTTPHTTIGTGDATTYAWPSAFAQDPTDADWSALVRSGVLAEDDVETLRAFGSYLGWRVGITPDGRWQYFIAGD